MRQKALVVCMISAREATKASRGDNSMFAMLKSQRLTSCSDEGLYTCTVKHVRYGPEPHRCYLLILAIEHGVRDEAELCFGTHESLPSISDI
jgi:hypothetical protein